jgi:predicted DNA-binding transcriptional regulator AlpA
MDNEARFLSKKDVKAKISLSYAQIARLEDDGRFPKRLRLGIFRNSRTVWLESEIVAWMLDRIAKRDAGSK